MGMAFMQRELPPSETVPGYIFIDYEGTGLARKVHGQVCVFVWGGDGGGGEVASGHDLRF
jgi:hypothetical protein